ncbi:hypothetical protein ACFLW7_03950 [Chloroflexota bacterium]
MKSKVLVSLLIASIMLFTLAAPALAKPEKMEPVSPATQTGTGHGSVRQNKDGHPIISVSIRKAIPNETYSVELQSNLGYWVVGTLTTNSRGAGRFKVVETDIGKYSGVTWFRPWLLAGSGNYRTTNTFAVEFS